VRRLEEQAIAHDQETALGTENSAWPLL
jgi:hypothetical protein